MAAQPAGRPRRPQPEWMQRKYAGASAADREARQLTAELLQAGLAAGTPQRYGDGRRAPFDDEGDARGHNNFTHDIARRLGLSYSGRLTDPATGKCEFCGPGWRDDKLRCPPSPAGGFDIHWRVWDKSHGRAHVVQHYGPDPANWHYDPNRSGDPARPHRRHEDDRQAAAAADPGPGRRFGAGRSAGPDPEPGLSRRAAPPTPAAVSTRPTARASDSGQAAQQQPEGLLEKLRRWTS